MSQALTTHGFVFCIDQSVLQIRPLTSARQSIHRRKPKRAHVVPGALGPDRATTVIPPEPDRPVIRYNGHAGQTWTGQVRCRMSGRVASLRFDGLPPFVTLICRISHRKGYKAVPAHSDTTTTRNSTSYHVSHYSDHMRTSNAKIKCCHMPSKGERA